MKTLRILNLEDDPFDADLIRANLIRDGVSCEVVRVGRREDFVAALEEGGYDLILSDYQLPDFDGFSAMEISLARRPEVPFLIVTGMLGEEVAVEALKRGATDYVLKDRIERLAPAVRRAVREAEERAERRRAENDRERLFDLSLDLLCIAGDDGYFKRLNPAFQETLGYSREELLGRPLTDFIHPDDRANTLAEIEKLRRGQATVNFKNRYLHRDGAIVWLAWKAVPVMEEGLIYASARDVTESKLAEEALQISEARFRSIVEQSPLSIQVFSPEGETIRVNRAWEELWGVTFDQIPGYNVLEDRQLVEKGLMPYIERGFAGEPTAIPPVEYQPARTIANVSGVARRWVRAFIYPVKDEAGSIREVTLIHEDITDRREAEEELARLASFPRLNPNPIIETSVEGEPTYLNPAAERNFPDVRDLGARHPMLTDLGSAARKIRSSHGRPFVREVRVNGRIYQQVISAVPENGLLRVYAIDITERHAAEEQTRSSHALLDAIIEGTGDPIFVKDLEGRYLMVNSATEKIMGKPRPEILGRNDEEIFSPEISEPLMAIDREVMEAGETRLIEELVPLEGEMRTFLSTKTPYRDHLDRVAGVIGVARDITDRREMEDMLREREERFRSLVQNATDIVTVFDAGGVITYESPSARMWLGYEPDELLGTNAFDYLHPDDVRRVSESFAGLLNHPGMRSPIEFRIRHADGSWHHFESIANNLLEEPAVRGIVVNSRDVTERKQAEDALRQSEELYRAVVEQAAENIFLVSSRTGRILEANPSLTKSLGYSAEEMRKMTLYDIVAHGRSSIEQNIQSVLQAGTSYLGERLYRSKDGSLVNVEVNVSVIPYNGEEALCVVAHDVTERKQAEDALRQSEELYRAVVEQSSEGIYIFDSGTGCILEANSSLHGLLGYEAGEIQGLDIYDIVAHSRENVDENIRRSLLEKNRFLGERRYRRKDGSVLDVEVSGSVVSYGGGEAICAILRDITARKRAEETLREVREAERNRLARDLHDVILQDVIDAMHSLEITQMKSREAETREDLEQEVGVLERSIMGLRNIVYNLRLSESRGDYPFTRLLESLVALNRQRAPECGISLHLGTGVPPSLPRESGMELMNVIREALVNVRRHSGARNASVAVSVEDGELRAEISDDGRGFEAGPREGGIGFSSMRERTGNLRGKLEVESEPGRGTRVALRVPVKELLDDG